jgi:HEAT repeat protein
VTRSNRLERQLTLLGRLRQTPVNEDGLETLRKALADRSSALVASAARIAGGRGLIELEENLAAAFERLAPGGTKADPGCNAKTAIVDALARLGSRREDVFMAGIRIVQMEPVWGGQEDTAAPLRAASALGLAGTRPPDLMNMLADLLADPVPDARLGAVAALAAAGDPAGVPLLRLKVRLGDAQPQLAFDCLSALVRLDPEGAPTLLAELLEHDDLTTAEAAALALGESGLAGASGLLQSWYERTLDKSGVLQRWLAWPCCATTRACVFSLRCWRPAHRQLLMQHCVRLPCNGATRRCGRA